MEAHGMYIKTKKGNMIRHEKEDMATERDTEEKENMATEREESITITAEESFRMQDEYWSKVQESEGFDIEDVKIPTFCPAMSCYDSRRPGSIPQRILVKGYATIGLHRYNMLEGTRFQLGTLLKVHITPTAVSSYYMTLDAYDPDTREQKTFQVRIDEKRVNTLDMTVSVARVKDEVITTTNKPFVPHFHSGAAADNDRFTGLLPVWPSDDAFNNTNRFYLVKESEWRNSDWITPYMELVVVANNTDILCRKDQNDILRKLKILKVVIETAEGVDEKLKAKSAYVYITFKGLEKDFCSSEVGEHVERKAVVRRVLDESTGYLSLRGKLWNGKTTSKRSKKKRARVV